MGVGVDQAGDGDGAARVEYEVGVAARLERGDQPAGDLQALDPAAGVAEPPRDETAEADDVERGRLAHDDCASSFVMPPSRACSRARVATAAITTSSSGSGASGTRTVIAS